MPFMLGYDAIKVDYSTIWANPTANEDTGLCVPPDPQLINRLFCMKNDFINRSNSSKQVTK